MKNLKINISPIDLCMIIIILTSLICLYIVISEDYIKYNSIN